VVFVELGDVVGIVSFRKAQRFEYLVEITRNSVFHFSWCQLNFCWATVNFQQGGEKCVTNVAMACRPERMIRPSITTRASAEEKARFVTVAASSGLSELALALKAIRMVLQPDTCPTRPYASAPTGVVATDRITIRLRLGDGEAIARRASQRGMKASTYLAALVRVHVAANPPLAAQELSALKRSMVVLAATGRLLAQGSRAPMDATLREDLQRTRAAVSALEQRTGWRPAKDPPLLTLATPSCRSSTTAYRRSRSESRLTST
jgi:hypothetical protein